MESAMAKTDRTGWFETTGCQTQKRRWPRKAVKAMMERSVAGHQRWLRSAKGKNQTAGRWRGCKPGKPGAMYQMLEAVHLLLLKGRRR